MPEFTVKWEIEIEAESSKEAAEIALQYLMDRNSTAKYFSVTQKMQVDTGFD